MAPYDLLGNRWVVGRIPEQVFADIDFEALLHKFLLRNKSAIFWLFSADLYRLRES